MVESPQRSPKARVNLEATEANGYSPLKKTLPLTVKIQLLYFFKI